VTVWSGPTMKWQIYTVEGLAVLGSTVMHAPVTYGRLPAGALQSYPPRGAPAPLAPGDWVTVEAVGASIDGAPYEGSGTTVL